VNDPASLNVSLDLSGLSLPEVQTLMSNMPIGSTWSGTASMPALGGMRYAVTIANLSIKGAADLSGALLSHLNAVAGEVDRG